MSTAPTTVAAGRLRTSAVPGPRGAGCGFEPCSHCASREYSVCAPLTDAELPGFYALASKTRVEPRRSLFEEGDAATHVYAISSGAVSLYKALADGRRQITGFLFDGDFIGLAHGATCAYTAEALTPVEVCRFTRERFENYMSEHPHMERRLLRIASTELASAQDQMLLLGRKTAMERVASFLLSLSDRAVAHGRPGNPIPLPMTRGEIGDYLGLTIETVSRTMTKLRKAGAIELDDINVVRMTSEARLRAAADAS